MDDLAIGTPVWRSIPGGQCSLTLPRRGRDWPFATPETVAYFNRLFEAYPLDEETRTAIDRGNAERRFPRLARQPAR